MVFEVWTDVEDGVRSKFHLDFPEAYSTGLNGDYRNAASTSRRPLPLPATHAVSGRASSDEEQASMPAALPGRTDGSRVSSHSALRVRRYRKLLEGVTTGFVTTEPNLSSIPLDAAILCTTERAPRQSRFRASRHSALLGTV